MNDIPSDDTTEVKNVTCAVRLDKPLYDRLVEVSKKSHKTMSELIRAGILKELENVSKDVMQRELEMSSLENELNQVRKLKEEMETLLKKKA